MSRVSWILFFTILSQFLLVLDFPYYLCRLEVSLGFSYMYWKRWDLLVHVRCHSVGVSYFDRVFEGRFSKGKRNLTFMYWRTGVFLLCISYCLFVEGMLCQSRNCVRWLRMILVPSVKISSLEAPTRRRYGTEERPYYQFLCLADSESVDAREMQRHWGHSGLTYVIWNVEVSFIVTFNFLAGVCLKYKNIPHS